MGQYTSYYLYQQYEQRQGQNPIPCTPNVYSIDANGTMPRVVKMENDIDCGYVPPSDPIYRWYQMPIETDYICGACSVPPSVGDYLTYVALEDAVIASNEQGLEYSLDNGNTWFVIDGSVSEIIETADGLKSYYVSNLIPSGSRVLLKGYFNHDESSNVKLNINSTGRFSVEGNPLSVVYGNSYPSKVDKQIYASAFKSLFANNLKLVSAENLIIPRVLSDSCCWGMFYKCPLLTEAPELPATTMTYDCYLQMFAKCTSLTTPPELPATTLARECYSDMFFECSGLTEAPELPATTLAYGCYANMFTACISLTEAPELPATTLADYCYTAMFAGCSLTEAPELPATTLADYCYNRMFSHCESLLAPPELSATTMSEGCYQEMFSYCSFVDLCDYKLPAIIMEESCYKGMFEYCSSLEIAPSQLPAIRLANNCYQNMFRYCYSLEIAPEKIDVVGWANNSMNSMFLGCSSLTKPCNIYIDGGYEGNNGYALDYMYSGCTSLDHLEAIWRRCWGLAFPTRDWVKDVKLPFYFLCDANTLDTQLSSGVTKIQTSLYGYYSLGRYISERECNIESSNYDTIVTITEPITNIKSFKSLLTASYNHGYIIFNSMDDTIELKISYYDYENKLFVNNLVIDLEEAFYSNEYNWITKSYNSFGLRDEEHEQGGTTIIKLANVDLYNHFGKEFYLKEMNVGHVNPTADTKAHTISYAKNIVDIVCDLENPCNSDLYQWNNFSTECYEWTAPYQENKCNVEKYQKTSDNGISWVDISPLQVRRGDVIELNSDDCGYISPTPSGETKYSATYIDGSTYFIECDSSSAITSSDTRYSSIQQNATYSLVTSVTIGDCVTSINDRAFGNSNIIKTAFPNLATVTIPNSVTSIGNVAFLGCDSLERITIPNSVTSIGGSAFQGCTSLTSITIPDSVTSIGERAFRGCYVTSGNFKNYSSLDEVYNDYWGCTIVDSRTDGYCIKNNELIKYVGKRNDVNIPIGVTSIGGNALGENNNFTTCTIPTSVTSIGNGAFENSKNLKSINIPDSVTSIGNVAFLGCDSLKNATIGSGITSIGGDAFAASHTLTSVTINATTPPAIDGMIFLETNILSIFVPCGSVDTYKNASQSWHHYASIIQGIPPCEEPTPTANTKFYATYNYGDTYSLACNSDTTLTSGETRAYGTIFSAMTSAVIGDCVTSIGQWAFSGCTSLTSVNIPSGVTTIGLGAFGGCSSLTSVTLPNSVTYISESTFAGCSGLTSVNIPSGVTTIDAGAFGGCSSLTSVTLPNNRLTRIWTQAFKGCSSITNLTLPETISGWEGLGNSAFAQCSSLVSINIPTGVTSIPSSIFAGCTSLTSITIPSGVTSIGGSAFDSCSSLTSITIPSGVTRIYDSAFGYCSSLTSITCYAPTPPRLYGSPFAYASNCPIYVPSGSVDTYKAASGWSTLASRIQPIS